jgi:hypothetical protein
MTSDPLSSSGQSNAGEDLPAALVIGDGVELDAA